MNPKELATELLALSGEWTMVSLVLGVRPTPVFKDVFAYIGEDSSSRKKSLNELQSEISTLMDHGYEHVGWILLYEYEPKQSRLVVQAWDCEDTWAVGVLRDILDHMRHQLTKWGHVIHEHQ
jgi:hypothetical protein